MAELTRRDAMRGAAGLAAIGLCTAPATAHDKAAKEPPLDAVFRVAVTSKGFIEFRFDTPGTADQTFESAEYRYAVLDKDGVQVDPAFMDKLLGHIAVVEHTAFLQKGERSVPDYSDYRVQHRQLKPGEDYYFVVSVRNLTALTKLKSA